MGFQLQSALVHDPDHASAGLQECDYALVSLHGLLLAARLQSVSGRVSVEQQPQAMAPLPEAVSGCLLLLQPLRKLPFQ